MKQKDILRIFLKQEYVFIFSGIFSLILTLTVGRIRPIALIIFIFALGYSGWNLYHSASKLISSLKRHHIPIVIVIGQGLDKVKSMWNEIIMSMKGYAFNPNFYWRYFQIEKLDFLLHHRLFLSTQPSDWNALIKEFESQKNRIEAILPGEKFLHFFILSPNAFAFGMGAATGRYAQVFLYHYYPPYKKVVDLSRSKENPDGARILESPVNEFRFVEGKGAIDNCKEIVVSIMATPEDPRKSAEELCQILKGQGKSVGFYHIVKIDGQPAEEEDKLVLCAREILTLIRNASQGKEKIHLLLSTHMPLSFLIGMGLGKNRSLVIYQKMPDAKYYPVLDLSKI